MSQEILLAVNNLSHDYHGSQAINNLNFEINRGEVTALLGTNGAGKSTTLNIITGNLKPNQGQVKICGHDIVQQAKNAKANLGYLPDLPPLYDELTVSEYLQFVAHLHGIKKTELKTALNHVLKVCDLHAVENKLIRKLSKGFKQRVGIAQAIIHNPALVVLDEPSVGLDPVQMQDIRTLLKELSKEHSVLLSTHLLAEVESSCDRVLIIDEGELLLDQKLEELQQDQIQRVKLRFQATPTVEELNNIAGCESASCAQYGNYICRYKDANFIEKVQALSLEKNWHLYEITPVASGLENVFLDLVVRNNNLDI